MNTSRKTAILVGALFLISYFGVFAGSAYYGPTLNAPDYPSGIYPNRSQVTTGLLLELLNDAAVVGIAVVLYPLLKKQSESIALGYVSFRVIEAIMLVVSKISPLSLIVLSEEYVAAGALDASYFQALAASAQAERFWAGQMVAVFFILGGLLFYYLLYQSRLLPRFISVWGFIAIASLIAANVFEVPDLTKGFHPAQLLYFPIVLNELFLAIWLIVKGFSPSAIVSEPA
jgi:hypothetical protein